VIGVLDATSKRPLQGKAFLLAMTCCGGPLGSAEQ
jgi:hypothetical protein